MNKIFLPVTILFLAVSCSKTEMQQTRETIRSANELLKSANDGIRNLDSISAVVTDSTQYNRVIKPKLEKQRKAAEKILSENSVDLDSLNAVLNRTRDRISSGTDIARTVDSAANELRNADNAIDALATISKALDKVSRQTKNKSANPAPQQTYPEDSLIIQNNIPEEPSYEAAEPKIYKNLKLQVTVDDLGSAEQAVRSAVYNGEGEILGNAEGEHSGHRTRRMTAKIPLKNFDKIQQELSSFGDISMANVNSTGTRYDPEQICDIEITLTENRPASGSENKSTDNAITTTPATNTPDEEKSIVSKIFDSALPFLPILLIIGAVWYFMNRKKKKRETREAVQQPPFQEPAKPREMFTTTSTSGTINPERYMPPLNTPPTADPHDPDPYAKYKPKTK